MTGVGALFALWLDPSSLFAQLQQPLKQAGFGLSAEQAGFGLSAEQAGFGLSAEQAGFGLSAEQAGAKLAEDRGIKARVGQLQSEQVLPIDTTTHGFGGLAVRQVLDKLQNRHQCQSP